MTTIETLERKTDILIPDLRTQVFPKGYELLPGLNNIYELELALAEAKALSKEELVERGAYFKTIAGVETNHSVLCSGLPLQVGKSSFRLRAFFETYRYKTSYATHGLFPYRGKFHPQLIKAIINIIGVQRGDLLLDPMTGSATTNIEASLIGIDSIGFDMNPFAVFMGKAKAQGLGLSQGQISEFRSSAESAFETISLAGSQKSLDENGETRSRDGVHPILMLAYLDALGYSRRVKTKKLPELLPIVLERYMASISNFIEARDKLGLSLGKITLSGTDARGYPEVRAGSVDAVITSPPYSFAIDYLKGDKLQLEFLGYDVGSLRSNMIGLRGSDLRSQVFAYLEDMNRVLSEVSRVLKRQGYAVIIVGSNTVQRSKIEEAVGLRLEDELVSLGQKNGLRMVQRFERPIEGVQNVMRSEHILFLRKN